MHPLGENSTSTPAFLAKLWKMVEDPATDEIICWSPSGTSFVITNQAQFWYELLPVYYKHNNMSSFVRQLNMYGFHKLSSIENGSMDADKDEIQFSHPYFIRDQPELLSNIKRKATTSKSHENGTKHDELNKVLTDVKQLRGRQNSVDAQINNMRNENALLWREVAILRQKHIKQQKIVNKLIQFLVTLVQPSRMTVGGKRGYQLMLNEGPNKKRKHGNLAKNSNTTDGPTIHELDNELELTPDLYEEEPNIDSPATSVASQQADLNSPLQAQVLTNDNDNETYRDKPELVDASDLVPTPDVETVEDNLLTTFEACPTDTLPCNDTGIDNQRVFLNSSAQDALLSNLIKDGFIVKSDAKGKSVDTETSVLDDLSSLPPAPSSNNMSIVSCDNNLRVLNKNLPSTSDVYGADLSSHVESTEQELEQFKDILNGYSTFDANALLGELNKMPHNLNDFCLFNEDCSIGGDFNVSDKKNASSDPADPLVSGSELTPYTSNFDFTELLDDDSIEGESANLPAMDLISAPLDTPQILCEEPAFPTNQNQK